MQNNMKIILNKVHLKKLKKKKLNGTKGLHVEKKAISQEEPQVWKCCDISYVTQALYAA